MPFYRITIERCTSKEDLAKLLEGNTTGMLVLDTKDGYTFLTTKIEDTKYERFVDWNGDDNDLPLIHKLNQYVDLVLVEGTDICESINRRNYISVDINDAIYQYNCNYTVYDILDSIDIEKYKEISYELEEMYRKSDITNNVFCIWIRDGLIMAKTNNSPNRIMPFTFTCNDELFIYGIDSNPNQIKELIDILFDNMSDIKLGPIYYTEMTVNRNEYFVLDYTGHSEYIDIWMKTVDTSSQFRMKNPSRCISIWARVTDECAGR